MKQSKGLNGNLNKSEKKDCIWKQRTHKITSQTTRKPQTGGRWARSQIRWYSRLSLSRARLSRITAYLEVKIWSLVLTQRSTNRQQNIVEKRRNCSLGAISPLFHNIFNISLTQEPNCIFILLKVVVRLIVFLSFANLICRSTDISKCLIGSLGFQDNGSRLYFSYSSSLFARSVFDEALFINVISCHSTVALGVSVALIRDVWSFLCKPVLFRRGGDDSGSRVF